MFVTWGNQSSSSSQVGCHQVVSLFCGHLLTILDSSRSRRSHNMAVKETHHFAGFAFFIHNQELRYVSAPVCNSRCCCRDVSITLRLVPTGAVALTCWWSMFRASSGVHLWKEDCVHNWLTLRLALKNFKILQVTKTARQTRHTAKRAVYTMCDI